MNTELQQRYKKYKKYQREVTELKNTATKLKNTLVGFHSGQGETDKRISDLADRALALTKTEQKKTVSKVSLRDLWDI